MAFLRALIVLAGTLATVTASAAQLYWIADDGIHRANLDGTGQQLIVPSPAIGFSGMAVDTSANRLYWIEGSFPFDIRYATLDGVNPRHFLTVEYAGGGIFVHPTTHDVWWGGRRNNQLDPITAVLYTSPDGSTSTSAFIPSKPDLNQFFIDAVAGKLYNVDTDDDGLSRMNLDGTSREFLETSNAMAVDPVGRYVYFYSFNSDAQTAEMHRMSFDGTAQEPLFTMPVPWVNRGFAFDPQSQTLFIGDNHPGVIYRVNIDGTGLQPIISTTDDGPWQMLVVVPEPSTLAMMLAALPLAYIAYRRRQPLS
jgi:hypothetical protein